MAVSGMQRSPFSFNSMIPTMPIDLKRSGTSMFLDSLVRCGSGHCVERFMWGCCGGPGILPASKQYLPLACYRNQGTRDVRIMPT